MTKILLTFALIFAANANAEVYKVDSSASVVTWHGSKKVGAKHFGKISLKDGEVVTNEKNEPIGGNFAIDMTTISDMDMASDPEHQKKLEGHLSSPDFFNVKKYPTSNFKITSITKKGNDHIVKGDLTIIGETHPVEFPAKITKDTTGWTGEGTVKIDRTKWNLKYGSGNYFKELTADKIINNEIELDLKLVARK
jgi:polyisoprenoid-binding protein YceI